MRSLVRKLCAAFVFALLLNNAFAEGGKKIAVTDLSFEERLGAYFQSYEMKGRYESSNSSSSSRGGFGSSRDRNSDHSREREEFQVKSSTDYKLIIDRGELHKFSADIKGGLLNSGHTLVQGRPWVQKNTEGLYDIIGRIKSGHFPGADYVLWGTISAIDFQQDDAPVIGSTAVSHTLSLSLTAEFSLISTKTYKVVAAFSAFGEGSDTKLTSSPGARVSLNRAKVVFETSRSLGNAVANELAASLDSGNRSPAPVSQQTPGDGNRVVVYH